jgi:hypothetical protein
LSGKIPEFLSLLGSLQALNLSFNDFEGPVPSSGIFGNSSRVSLKGNYRICANSPESILPLCPKSGSKWGNKSAVFKIVIPIAASGVLILLLFIAAILFRRRKELQRSSAHIERVMYEDTAEATNGFSPVNLVGLGSFGPVYKGILPFENDPVAIKVFNLNQYGAPRSFI